jgi:hypothetical protein
MDTTTPSNPKPKLKLYGAVFIGSSLFGYNYRKKVYEIFDKSIKTSKVIKRLSKTKFETMNSIYQVYFVPGGATTIPKDLRHYPGDGQ